MLFMSLSGIDKQVIRYTGISEIFPMCYKNKFNLSKLSSVLIAPQIKRFLKVRNCRSMK